MMVERIVKAAVDCWSGSGEGSGYKPREHGCGGEVFRRGAFCFIHGRLSDSTMVWLAGRSQYGYSHNMWWGESRTIYRLRRKPLGLCGRVPVVRT